MATYLVLGSQILYVIKLTSFGHMKFILETLYSYYTFLKTRVFRNLKPRFFRLALPNSFLNLKKGASVGTD